VLAPTVDVFLDEIADRLGAEQAPIETDGIEQDAPELVLQVIAEPSTDGDAEAHLRAGLDRRGE
jgi:hypothetical protein